MIVSELLALTVNDTLWVCIYNSIDHKKHCVVSAEPQEVRVQKVIRSNNMPNNNPYSAIFILKSLVTPIKTYRIKIINGVSESRIIIANSREMAIAIRDIEMYKKYKKDMDKYQYLIKIIVPFLDDIEPKIEKIMDEFPEIAFMA